eukprot:m51a1_g4230 putative ornithine cyclodeaminase (317) ;mRNA; f:121267-122217
MVLFLSAEDLSSLGLPTRDAVRAVSTALRQHALGKAQCPAPSAGLRPRPHCHVTCAHAHVGGGSSSEASGVRWSTRWSSPSVARGGLPASAGLVAIADPATGIPLALMDSARLAGLRALASVVLAASLLARPASASAAVFCERPDAARGLVDALVSALPALRAVSLAPAAPEQLAADLRSAYPAVAFSAGAAGPADVAVVVCSDAAVGLRAQALAEGATVIAVDADVGAVPADVVAACGRVFADDSALAVSLGPRERVLALGDAVAAAGGVPRGAGEKVLVALAGPAMLDVAVARAVYDHARIMGVGTQFSMYPRL